MKTIDYILYIIDCLEIKMPKFEWYNFRMPWIRIFRTRREAEVAKKLLSDGGIESFIVEHDLDGVPIVKYGVPARFSLEVHTREDYFKAAEYLAKKIKSKKMGRNKKD